MQRYCKQNERLPNTDLNVKYLIWEENHPSTAYVFVSYIWLDAFDWQAWIVFVKQSSENV